MEFDSIPYDLYTKLYDNYVTDYFTCDEALTPESFKEFWDALTEEERDSCIEKTITKR